MPNSCKLKSPPSVAAIYHYARPEKGDENTIIIWKSKESLIAYRQGELVKEARAVAGVDQLMEEATWTP